MGKEELAAQTLCGFWS